MNRQIKYNLENVSSLVKAILQNDAKQVEYLINNGDLKFNSLENGYEETPLVVAVHAGNIEIINKLIVAGVNLDELDWSYYVYPIGMAIWRNRPDIVELLLNAGANPELGELEYTALTVAISNNNYTILQMLLEAGANPDAGMEDDYRAIMAASCYGHLDMVELLVLCGADVNAIGYKGQTAIDSAAENGHQDVYDYLYPLLNEENKRYADEYCAKKLDLAIKRKARLASKLNNSR